MKKCKEEVVSFPDLKSAMEAENKARLRLNELRLTHCKCDFSWKFLLVLVNVAEKRVDDKYVNDWLQVNYSDDVKEFIRCERILEACDRYYDEHGFAWSSPAFHFDGGYIDGIVNTDEVH